MINFININSKKNKEVSYNPDAILEEWVWVDGYKGVNLDYSSKFGFFYKVGETYKHNGEIKIRRSGFHFSLKLEDTFNYYSFLKSRFLKVKGLVRKSDLDKYGTYDYENNEKVTRITQIAAKEIIVEEEVSLEELFKTDICSKYKFIDCPEEIESVRDLGYKDFVKLKSKKMLKPLGYSEDFAYLLYEEYGKDEYNLLYRKIKTIITLTKEGFSKEAVIYLVFK